MHILFHIAQTGMLLPLCIPAYCFIVGVISFAIAAVITEFYRVRRINHPNGEAWLDEGTVRFLLAVLIFILLTAWYLIAHWNDTLAL